MNDIQAGLNMAKSNAMGVIKFFINYIAVPLGAAVILGFVIFFIISAAKKHKMGEDYQDDIIKIVVALVMLALVVSFPAWGWRMIGETADTASAAAIAGAAVLIGG